MRPQSLEDFEGQSDPADGRLLRRAIKADRVGNLILHGPPGVGNLARIIAGARAHFAASTPSSPASKTSAWKWMPPDSDWSAMDFVILFIDEVHRFNSAQQDALLPQKTAPSP